MKATVLIIGILLLLSATLVSAQPVITINSAQNTTINLPISETNITHIFNITTSELSLCNLSLNGTIYDETAPYQETPDDIGSPVGSWINASNVHDTDWSTSGYATSGPSNYINFNYTKPTNVNRIGTTWRVKDGTGTFDLTFGQKCWDSYSNKVRLRSNSNAAGNSVLWMCWEQADGHWDNIKVSAGTTNMYEEAVIWKVNPVCYQETANISTFCGGLSTGDYNESAYGGGTIVNPGDWFDGNWSTWSSYSGGGVHFNISYTIPAGTISAIWEVKEYNGRKNLTINSSLCDFSVGNQLYLRAEAQGGFTYPRWYCYNNSAWNTLYTGGPGSGNGRVYEEGIYWFMNSSTAHLWELQLTRGNYSEINYTCINENGTENSITYWLNADCVEDWQNTSWTSWYNLTTCFINDTIQQERNRTEYDNNACGGANTTYYEQQWVGCTNPPDITWNWPQINSTITSTNSTTICISLNQQANCTLYFPTAPPSTSPPNTSHCWDVNNLSNSNYTPIYTKCEDLNNNLANSTFAYLNVDYSPPAPPYVTPTLNETLTGVGEGFGNFLNSIGGGLFYLLIIIGLFWLVTFLFKAISANISQPVNIKGRK